MTADEQAIVAQAVIVLTSHAPADAAMGTIMALESILPPSGTPEARAAFAEAHARLERLA